MTFDEALANPATRSVTSALMGTLERSGVRSSFIKRDAQILREKRLTPLHFVQCVEDVRLYIEQGADPNAFDDRGGTPLWQIVWDGDDRDAEVVSELLKHGANPNAWHAEEPDRVFPLHPLHVVTSKLELARLLLDHGADIHALDHEQSTPLHSVCGGPTTQLLIERGADVNFRDARGMTPLHRCRAETLKAQQLIEAGAEVNACDNTGESPLFANLREAAYWLKSQGPSYFFYRGVIQMFRFLMAKGADPFQPNNEGLTPYDFAVGEGARDVVGVFVAHRRQREALTTAPERNQRSRSRERS